MYRLFNIDQVVNQAVHSPPNWNLISRGIKDNAIKAATYYNKTPIAVNSNHLLVRLITALGVPISQPIDRYYENVRDSCLSTCMLIGITSAIFKGHLMKGVFYGPGCREVVIAHADDFDYEEAERNWETLEPIKVIRHPRTDLGYNVPNGQQTGIETGLCTILINVPMLAVQYRSFRINEQRISEQTGMEQRSLQMFVHMYPLANMIYSQTDVVIFNRLRALSYGAPLGNTIKNNPFFVTDYNRLLNDYLKGLIAFMRRDNLNFIEVLRNIRLTSYRDLYEFFKLPDIAPTRQVVWALSLGCLDMIEYLFKYADIHPDLQNSQHVNRVFRRLREFRNANVMQSILPPNILIDYQLTIEELYEIANRRI